jgi:hypothetical protein
MATDNRRTCPIFRIERGTFQESHTRTLNFDYPSLNDEENVFLRVTKLSSSENSSPLSSSSTNNHHHHHHQSNKKLHSSTKPYRDAWDDAGRSLNDNNRPRLHSLSDDYVFL